MSTSKLLFTAKNISLEFVSGAESKQAVKKCDLTIPDKKITIIFGPSGSGKSSLLNILSGLQIPTSGNLYFKNEDVYKRSKNQLAYFRAHELGILYQSNYWVKSLDVLDNVALPLYFLGYSRNDAHQKALAALDHIHMKEYASKYPILLSGGEQQRIAMARAIVNDSPVIIADEPTGNLDSKNGDKIIDLLIKMNKDFGKTIILVTHNMEYLPIAKHLLQIQDGTITEIAQKDIEKTVHTLVDEMEKRIVRLKYQAKD